MIDPSVTTPEELASHFSAYAARLADALEKGPGYWPEHERGMALKHIAQGLEYARLSILAAVETTSPVNASERDQVSRELDSLMRRVSEFGNQILRAQEGRS